MIWVPICITKQQVEPLSKESKSRFFNFSSAETKACVIILQLFSFNFKYICWGSFNAFISGWFIIWEGINSEANSETKWPSGPCPSKTPKILKSFILFIFLFAINESWFVLVIPISSLPGLDKAPKSFNVIPPLFIRVTCA